MGKLLNDITELSKIFEKQEVKQFFQKIKQIKNGATTTFETPGDLQILILDMVSTYSKLYNLIEPFFPIVPGRIIIGNDVTEAEFKRDGDPATLQDFAAEVTFDFENGFKAIKVIFIDNHQLDNQLEEFEIYIIKNLAKAIALALDNGILNGQGADSYQMEGVIKNIPTQNKIDVTAESLTDIIKPINLLDSGKYNDNEIVAIVNRNTYYSKLLDYLLNCSNPGVLPKFISCYAMPENKILYADFEKYILIQRGNFVLERSKHVRFPYDETGYKGKANFDGKPGRPQAFVLVTLQ